MSSPGAITFGGHSTVVVELGGTRLVTDPLLRPRLLGLIRRHHGFSADSLGRVDGVLISHLHLDHLDLASLRRIGTRTPIIAPRGAGTFLAGRGVGAVTELDPGGTTEVGEVTVTAVDARHPGGRLFGRGPGETLGYVLGDGARVYFAGDTDLFPEMAAIAPDVDVALLPIWGWAPKLGPGHLDPESAAEAAALIGPRAAVPIHWGSLAPLGAGRLWPWHLHRPADEFAAALARVAPEVQARVLAPGETLDLAELT